jgi:hypothetical protein
VKENYKEEEGGEEGEEEEERKELVLEIALCRQTSRYI